MKLSTTRRYEARKSYETRKACFSEIAYVGLTVLLSLLGGGLGMIFYTRSALGREQDAVVMVSTVNEIPHSRF